MENEKPEYFIFNSEAEAEKYISKIQSENEAEKAKIRDLIDKSVDVGGWAGNDNDEPENRRTGGLHE